MDLETTQNNSVAKLPILKQGDYEMWKLRIEQYFQVQDYALWEVIEYGNSFKPVARTTTNADGSSTSTIPGPVTTEEKAQKKNDVKARSMLLMALPNEHQLTFSQYKDAKTLFEAIQARFGGNEATKKTQRTLLKQMYENFSASSQESLDSISNRLQKIVSQLAILDLDTISFDDLYNNFKLVEQEVKRSVTSSSNSSSQNVAFVSTPGRSNEDNAANVQVNTVSTNVSTASTNDSIASPKQIHEDDLEEMDLKWQLALLSLKARKFYQRTGKKIIINGSDTDGYDKSKVECFNCYKMGHFYTSSKVMVAFDGAGFDWSFMDDEEVPTNLALMVFSDLEPFVNRLDHSSCICFVTLAPKMSVAVIYSNSLEAIFRSSPEHHLDYHRWNLCSLSMRINCSFVFVLVDDPLGSGMVYSVLSSQIGSCIRCQAL
ncbi:hypothetical protein Tco_0053207 [Tanacetum coccineum]